MYIKINDKNRVVLQIADKFAEGMKADNKTTFKVETIPTVEHGEVLCYNAEIKTFYTEARPKVTEEQKARVKTKSEAKAKKAKALKWLANNDWKVNKRVLGEWSEEDPRWQEYIEGRNKARQDIDAAESILNK